MASAKESTARGLEETAARTRELNERIIDTAIAGGETSLDIYEDLLRNVAAYQESAGAKTSEWVEAFAGAQAKFTRELAAALPSAARSAAKGASELAGAAADQVRRVPGVAEAEGEVRGVGARGEDLPIARYDSLNVDEVITRLPKLSKADLAKVDAYERKHGNRKTVRDKIASLSD